MLRPGDTLVTVRLDRLARSIQDLLSLLDTIKAAGAYIKHWTIHGSTPRHPMAS
jgi:DNA invertase Pin-like site-specific DNA recombinase